MQGCGNKPITVMTLGEWIKEINQKASIQTFQQAKPYYLNIPETSPYYEDIQKAVEWEILEASYPFNPEASLTREWAAYTLLNLAGIELAKENDDIKDLKKATFPKHVSTAISSGLMKLNKVDCFEPKKEMDRYDAEVLLEEVVAYINTKQFEDSYIDIDFSDIEIEPVTPIEEHLEDNTIYVEKDSGIKSQDYLTYSDSNNHEKLIQATHIKEEDEYDVVSFVEPEMGDVITSIDLQDSFEIDFTNAEVFDLIDGNLITSSSYTFPSSIKNMSNLTTNYSHSINGYQIQYHLTSSGLFAEISKAGSFGSKMYASFTLNGVKPSVKWKMNHGKIEEGYFLLNFNTTEKLGVEASYETIKYGDFNSFNIHNLKSSFENLFKDKQEIENITVPICEIRFPIPNMPVASITIQLNLKIYASGKAEIVLAQEEMIGMEIRNGNIRSIHDVSNDAKSVIKASSSFLSNLLFGLKVGDYLLADISVEGGAKANLDSEIHIYDEDNNHQVVKANLPIDLVEHAIEGNGDLLSCANLKAYWVLDAILNSSGSAAGKLGLSKTISILNENNSTLIPGLSSHLENGMFVAQCTRKDRDQTRLKKRTINSNIIDLDSYHLIIKEGASKQLIINKLPDEYKKSDLEYTIDNPSIASIDEKLIVHGIEEGSTIIQIRTKDQKYEIDCTVIVTKT